jgi:putative membrane protein
MRSLTDTFLSQNEREKITAAVQAAERKTAGEIVPMVVSSSYHYPVSDILAAVTFSFPLAIGLTYVLGTMYWSGSQNMWMFIISFALCYAGLHVLLKKLPQLKRLFISQAEIEEEVNEAAITAFFQQGLYRTREETGVLIFISVFERKVVVLADRGINARVDSGAWDEVVHHIVRGIKNRQQANALCEAVEMVGGILEQHFPVKEDDTDELHNLIVI